MKPGIAFLLGVGSFVLMMAVGEGSGLVAAFAVLTVYFFVCQFLLSRGNRGAMRTDGLVMLALAAVPLVAVVLMAVTEKREVLLSQGAGLLLSTVVGILGGAFAASRVARK
jgi:hypothetical protein